MVSVAQVKQKRCSSCYYQPICPILTGEYLRVFHNTIFANILGRIHKFHDRKPEFMEKSLKALERAFALENGDILECDLYSKTPLIKIPEKIEYKLKIRYDDKTPVFIPLFREYIQKIEDIMVLFS